MVRLNGLWYFEIRVQAEHLSHRTFLNHICYCLLNWFLISIIKIYQYICWVQVTLTYVSKKNRQTIKLNKDIGEIKK